MKVTRFYLVTEFLLVAGLFFSVLYVTRFIQYDYEIRKILYKNKKGRVENAFLYIFSSKKPLDLISSFYNGT